MRTLILLLLLILSLRASSQTTDTAKLIGIHPAVGKEISRDEKIRYHLFPEYKDSLFESAEVRKYNDSTFMLSVRTIQGTSLNNYITTKQLDELFYHIEDVEKGKKQVEYVMTEEEKKEERRKRVHDSNNEFWYNFLAQMTIMTFEVLISAALSN